MARDSKTISQFQNDLHELTSKLNENEDCLQKKQEELEKANELIMKLEEQIQKAKENRVDPISRRSEVHAGNDIDAISSLENEIGLKEKDIMIKELEQEIQNLATSRITESEIFKTTDWLQSTTPDQTEELVKLKKELKTLEETTESLRKREEQTKRRLSKQQEMDKELDKSIKLLEEKEREIKNLKDDLEKEKTKIKDLKEVLVVDGGKVSDLEARLENEVKRGQILLSDKQTDLVVHANELKHKAQRIKELESSLPQEHEPMNNGQSAFDVKSDLEREIRKSSMLNKQIETFKISLNSKRKIIESQETEVINSQKRLHKANRKIRHLENEVYYQLSDLVALETKLDGVYLKSRYKGKNPRGRNYERRKSRGNPRVRRGGGMGNDFDFEKRRRRPKHQRDKQSEILVGGEISVDDLSVNQCLDLFKKKMTTARRQLEAVQDKISHNDAWDKHKRRGR
jgi:chromosome segregation ATPase